MKVRNTFVIFLVSGFWHGANWTFIIWGFLNALYIMPSIVLNTNRTNLDIVAKGKLFPSIKEVMMMTLTFSLTVFAWIFFRSENISDAFLYISRLFTTSLFTFPTIKPIPLYIALLIFIIIEWLGREEQFAIAKLGNKLHRMIRWTLYYVLIYTIFYHAGAEQQFIYFQF